MLSCPRWRLSRDERPPGFAAWRLCSRWLRQCSVSGTAAASVAFGDRNVHDPTLAVSARGIAVVTYTTQDGQERHVLAWGAVNAYPHQTEPPVTQTHFSLDYSGGWKSHGRATFWQTLHNVCKPYTGPALPFFVTGCDAPDGSYWALQSWQRNLPVGGFAPWTAAQTAGRAPPCPLERAAAGARDLPALDLRRNAAGLLRAADLPGPARLRVADGLGGRQRHLGAEHLHRRPSTPISGAAGSTTPRSARIRAAAASASRSSPRRRRRATRAPSRRATGSGRAIAISAIGPGVTPIVQWQAARLTTHDPQQEQSATQAFDRILGADAHCAAER